MCFSCLFVLFSLWMNHKWGGCNIKASCHGFSAFCYVICFRRSLFAYYGMMFLFCVTLSTKYQSIYYSNGMPLNWFCCWFFTLLHFKGQNQIYLLFLLYIGLNINPPFNFFYLSTFKLYLIIFISLFHKYTYYQYYSYILKLHLSLRL